MSRADVTQRKRLPAGRKAELADFVQISRQVTVGELAEHFAVSIDTIRRDLDQLDREGLVIRTHGGAVAAADRQLRDRGLDVRLRMQSAEKDAIAKIAATLIDDGAVILINAGTTALALARALRNHSDLTIATNNLQLPAEIAPTAFRDLYLLGGSVRAITQATTGPVSLPLGPGGRDMEIRADLALIAVGAVDAHGYTTSNAGDAAMMNEMSERANRTIILADSSKFDRRLFAQVSGLDAASYLVTDAPPPPHISSALEDAGVEVLSP